MRVLAFTKYGARAASTRQRLLQYIPYLEEHGIGVDYLPLLGDDYVQRLAEGRSPDRIAVARSYARRVAQLVSRRGHDLLWVHYELFPYLPGWAERIVRISGAPIVCDMDDAIFHMYDSHRSPVVRRLLGRKLLPLLEAASGCACGNSYLRDYVAPYCPNSIVLPTVVDTAAYVPACERHDDRPVIGWIGSPSTWKYVEPLLPILRRVADRHGAILRSVGAGPDARAAVGVDAREWSEEGEIAEVQAMDVGIMPLPDESWARGKCGYKLIQYMACGLPVVASPVGVNSEIVSHETNGFLASTPDEWEACLDRLIEDRDLRTRMGKAGRARVETSYSLASQAPRFLELLRSAAGHGS